MGGRPEDGVDRLEIAHGLPEADIVAQVGPDRRRAGFERVRASRSPPAVPRNRPRSGSAASHAWATVSATTKATGSPTNLTAPAASGRPVGARGSATRPARLSGSRIGASDAMTPSPSACQSSWVSTASTPGAARAAVQSMPAMRAWAWGRAQDMAARLAGDGLDRRCIARCRAAIAGLRSAAALCPRPNFMLCFPPIGVAGLATARMLVARPVPAKRPKAQGGHRLRAWRGCIVALCHDMSRPYYPP